jgi:hypothetical protein
MPIEKRRCGVDLQSEHGKGSGTNDTNGLSSLGSSTSEL